MPTPLLRRLWPCIIAVRYVEAGTAPKANPEDAKSVRECMMLKRELLVEVGHRVPMYRPLGNVVSFDAVLSEAERDMILGLEECVRGTGNHIQDREFEDTDGGNNVTYLNQFMQDWLPALTVRIRDIAQGAVNAADFQVAISQLGIRCVELLRYVSADGWSDVGFHEDGESTYTLVFMLSEPGHDFNGGAFQIHDGRGGDITLRQVDFGHGFLFDSETPHRVLTVESGTRTVLVLEFWNFADSTLMDFRPPRKFGKPLRLEL